MESGVEMVKFRSSRWGSKSSSADSARAAPTSRSRSGSASRWARGVGSIRLPVRTNSGSPTSVRSRASAWLTADWLTPSASAARETLRVSSSASNTLIRLRSSAGL